MPNPNENENDDAAARHLNDLVARAQAQGAHIVRASDPPILPTDAAGGPLDDDDEDDDAIPHVDVPPDSLMTRLGAGHQVPADAAREKFEEAGGFLFGLDRLSGFVVFADGAARLSLIRSIHREADGRVVVSSVDGERRFTAWTRADPSRQSLRDALPATAWMIEVYRGGVACLGAFLHDDEALMTNACGTLTLGEARAAIREWDRTAGEKAEGGGA